MVYAHAETAQLSSRSPNASIRTARPRILASAVVLAALIGVATFAIDAQKLWGDSGALMQKFSDDSDGMMADADKGKQKQKKSRGKSKKKNKNKSKKKNKKRRQPPGQMVKTMAGSPAKSREVPDEFTDPASTARVRCCGHSGETVSMSTYGCNADKTFAEAATICSTNDLRLCTADEMAAGAAQGTGCGYDNQRVWTGTFGAQDCEGSYSAWSTCSEECGGGISTRTFSVTTLAGPGGHECPTLVETRQCNERPCGADCVEGYSDWEWDGVVGGCSEACGTGKTRKFWRNASPTGEPCRKPLQQKSITQTTCNNQPCPPPSAGTVDCSGSWSAWSAFEFQLGYSHCEAFAGEDGQVCMCPRFGTIYDGMCQQMRVFEEIAAWNGAPCADVPRDPSIKGILQRRWCVSDDDPADPQSGFLDGEISYHPTGSAQGFILKDGTEHVGTESNLGIDGEPSDKSGNLKRWNDNPSSWQTAPTSLSHYKPVPYEGLGGKFPKYGNNFDNNKDWHHVWSGPKYDDCKAPGCLGGRSPGFPWWFPKLDAILENVNHDGQVVGTCPTYADHM